MEVSGGLHLPGTPGHTGLGPEPQERAEKEPQASGMMADRELVRRRRAAVAGHRGIDRGQAARDGEAGSVHRTGRRHKEASDCCAE